MPPVWLSMRILERGCPVGEVLAAAAALREAVGAMAFSPPVAYVYHPLAYAWDLHAAYVQRYGGGRKQGLFLGMNPGPFGMAQTGVPFGEVAAVRDWMGLVGEVGQPPSRHPKRPVEGFACTRSEVSGRRLWGLFAARFGRPECFFEHHFVLNYCPLLFTSETGANLTPDKLPVRETEALYAACDAHLLRVVKSQGVQWVAGVGAFAEGRAREVLSGQGVQVFRILHPSPASPAANRGWPEQAVAALREAGVWA